MGKASDLRSRVRSYFGKSDDGRAHLRLLVPRIVDVEVTVTPTPEDALLLEDDLIKRHRPAFNVMQRDDKAHLMLRIDRGHTFPRIETVRRGRESRTGETFGPYVSSRALRETLRLLGSILPLRDCSDRELANRSRPCVKHQIGRCSAPCTGLIGEADYGLLVDRAIGILRGGGRTVLKDLERRKEQASQGQDYEAAARWRDRAAALRETLRPATTDLGRAIDRDVVGITRSDEGQGLAVVMCWRRGRLSGSRTRSFSSLMPEPELLLDLLTRIYDEEALVPAEILVPTLPNERALLEGWLGERRGTRVAIRVPKRGTPVRQLGAAGEQAVAESRRRGALRDESQAALDRLGDRLGLAAAPRVVDGYDVSHFQGAELVASRVRFTDGVPDRRAYRSFRIKTVLGQDDYASMREVVARALRQDLKRGKSADVLVIDGGKGQLRAAEEAAQEVGIWDLSICALAKDRARAGGRTGERLFVPGRSAPMPLRQGAADTMLLQRIRDEAHRRAVRHHRARRDRPASRLDGVPGVGPKRRTELLRQYGSTEGVLAASDRDLAKILPARVLKDLRRLLAGT